MIERIQIQIDSKYSNENPIQFLKHHGQSNNLAVIFPGGDNSTDVPTLHYARKAALLIGCDVLSLKYGVPSSKLNFNDNDVYKTIINECYDAMEKANYQEYKNIIFISKSIGNLIALDVDKQYLNSEVTQILYTPVEDAVEKIEKQNCLIFTGDNDKFISRECVELLKGYCNVNVYQFTEAVHSLEVNDDIHESLNILTSVTEILSEYLKKHINGV